MDREVTLPMGMKVRMTIEIPEGCAHPRGFAKSVLHSTLIRLRKRVIAIEPNAYGVLLGGEHHAEPAGSYIVEQSQ
jgi:hypothetical protein